MKRGAICFLALTFAPLAAAQQAPGATKKEREVEQRLVPPAAPVIADTGSSARQVAKTISECAEDMACPSLLEFRKAHEAAFKWLQAWCVARELNARSAQIDAGARARTPEGRVCSAAQEDRTKPNEATRAVSVFDLVETSRAIYTPNCSGFGLTVPLYSIRHTDRGTVANGPVKAGLGGGYYWALKCEGSFSYGPEVFGYSEGLDPSGLLQIGVAGGFQLVAFKYFQFGLAVGYDVYRRDRGIPTNGLLSGQYLGKESISWLLTFSVVPQAAQSEK